MTNNFKPKLNDCPVCSGTSVICDDCLKRILEKNRQLIENGIIPITPTIQREVVKGEGGTDDTWLHQDVLSEDNE